MTLQGIRSALAAHVAAALPADTVTRPYGVNLDSIDHPTVLVFVDSIDPPSVACPADVAHVDVLVVTHLREPGTADDALDALFDLAAPAADAFPGTVKRGTAERVTYLDTWPAYRIPLEVST